jgi:hypothetical protein
MASDSEDDLEIFVVVHDPSIIEQLEAEQHFSMLPNYRYILVGHASRYANSDFQCPARSIVAQLLPNNLEEHKNLLTFTAWYAIVKNQLANTKFVTILEYDVDVDRHFQQRTIQALQEGHRMVGYVPFPLTHPQYLHATDWFTDSLTQVYDIDAAALVDSHLSGGGADLWTATTNLSMRLDDLEDFVDWFLPLSRIFRHDPVGAHVHERSVPIYCMIRGIENFYLPELLQHYQKLSHGARVKTLEEAQKLALVIRRCRESES